MEWVIRRIPSEGVSAKGSYWDDAFSKSQPAAAFRVVKTIMKLEAETYLKPNLTKFHLYAPNERVAEQCRELFAEIKGIEIHNKMNIVFLRTPIGSDEFVESKLNTKLKELKEKVNNIVRLPHKMEAF